MRYLFIALALGVAATLQAADVGSEEASELVYRLNVGDVVEISIFQEPELSRETRINARGMVNLPLIGDTRLSGKTVSEAQAHVAQAYIDQRLLRRPQVTVLIREYAMREVSVLGQVRNPGKYPLPVEAELSVVDLITKAGGLTDIARGNQVRVTRINEQGEEETVRINVDSIFRGRSSSRGDVTHFLLRPGDIVFVPESLF